MLFRRPNFHTTDRTRLRKLSEMVYAEISFLGHLHKPIDIGMPFLKSLLSGYNVEKNKIALLMLYINAHDWQTASRHIAYIFTGFGHQISLVVK